MMHKLIKTFIIIVGFSGPVLTIKATGIEQSASCKTYFFKGLTSAKFQKDTPESFLCPQTQNLIMWFRHLKSHSSETFDERVRFLMKNPELPSNEKLQQMTEFSLSSTNDPKVVRIFFSKMPPITSKGSFIWASLLLEEGKNDQAIATVKKAWHKFDFSPAQQEVFITKFKNFLEDLDYKKRIDFLFASKKYDQVKMLLPILPQKIKTLVLGRLSVIAKKQSMDLDIQLVSHVYKEDPGLLYDLVSYFNSREDYSESLKLIEKMKPSIPEEAEGFFRQRSILARESLKKHQYQLAFDLAKDHGIELCEQTQKAFSSASELAGWIALHYMNEPAQAIEYFKTSFENYKTKFSKSKVAFYASMAQGKMNNPEGQKIWLEKAADAPGSFYGQLALSQLQKPFPEYMHIAGSSIRVQNHSLMNYGKLLCYFEQFEQASLFFATALKDLKSKEDYIHFASIISKNLPIHNRTHLFKIMMKDQHILFKEAFPIPDPLENLDSRNLSVFLSLMLQESNFNEKAISPAGALGISQVMPNTAKETAKKMKISYVAKNLMNAEYNSKIGNFHFNELFDSFSSSIILSSAAYNAGKDKVLEWIQTYGDPRSKNADKLAFIQQIPYHETRSYVEFILGNYGIYKNLLAQRKEKKKKKRT